MPEGISIDVGNALPYIEDRLRALFGQDPDSIQWKSQIALQANASLRYCASVQCVGMSTPIPIQDIYQPTRLRRGKKNVVTDAHDLIKERSNAIIFAGPGWGKTTLLHWIYYRMATDTTWVLPNTVPVLFTLRWPGAVDNLITFVEEVHKGRRVGEGNKDFILLLVDGYDEISEEERQIVSRVLGEFAANSFGYYWLTCRSSYHVYELKADHYEIERFDENDSWRFVSAFLRIYGVSVDARELLNELYRHRLGDFASHPLMLALVCILKSGPNKEIPRRAIGLVRRAIDTLTFRWDEAKGINRTSRIALDGEERVRCLMRIAYEMLAPQAENSVVENALRAHVTLIQAKGVETRKLLQELAQWYGLLIPADHDHWQFVHRIIHDYLAARYWVESGQFIPAAITGGTMRTAYATCLVPDGTVALVRMLKLCKEFEPIAECIYNAALFDHDEVATAYVDRTAQFREYEFRFNGKEITAHLQTRLIEHANDDFIRALIRIASARSTDAGDTIALYAALELRRRGELSDRDLFGGRLRTIFLPANHGVNLGRYNWSWSGSLADLFVESGADERT